MKKLIAVLLLAGIVFAQVGASQSINVAGDRTEGLPFEH